VHNIFLFNLAFAAYSLLPIPPLAGSRILFHSRMIYALALGTFASYAILITLRVYSFIYAVIIGILVWLIYYIWFEKKVKA